MQTAKEILTSHNKFYINLGLLRIEKILELLGNPQEHFKVIHVAGTNGKGSTCKLINEILIQNFTDANVKVGLFTSPHLFSYTERIKINNIDILESDFDFLVNKIDDIAKKHKIELTEFELLTAVGFYYFYIKKVEYAVVEVGLGGLYDATNVIKKPLIEAITELDLDHTQRLGSTIEEIAIQKAGIIKENSKVIFLKTNKGSNILEKIAKEKKAEIVIAPKVSVEFKDGVSYAYIDTKRCEFNLLGHHQADNLALAIGAINAIGLNINFDILQKALKFVKWPFRLEYHKENNLLIDGAHNPSGVRTLRKFLDDNFKNNKKTFVFGCLNNKDYKKMLDILLEKDDEFYFYEFNYPNALKYEELDERYKKIAKKVLTIEDIKKIIKEKQNLKVFCGSLYMLGRIFSEILI